MAKWNAATTILRRVKKLYDENKIDSYKGDWNTKTIVGKKVLSEV